MDCKVESVNENELEIVDMLSLRPRAEPFLGDSEKSVCFVGLDDLCPSSAASARARSSHLLRTLSRLAPGLWEGVHRLLAETGGTAELEPDPVVVGLMREVGRDEMDEFRTKE